MPEKTDLMLAAVKAVLSPGGDYDGKNSPGAQAFLGGGRTAPLAPEVVDNLTSALARSTERERAEFAAGLLQLLAPAVQLLPPGVGVYVNQFIAQVLGRGGGGA